MNLDTYQTETARTDRPALFNEAVANHAMGLAGETGELVDALKKLLFHGHKVEQERVRNELGDVLWYVARIAADFGLTLSEVADANIAKLRARYPEGFSTEASIARVDAQAGAGSTREVAGVSEGVAR